MRRFLAVSLALLALGAPAAASAEIRPPSPPEGISIEIDPIAPIDPISPETDAASSGSPRPPTPPQPPRAPVVPGQDTGSTTGSATGASDRVSEIANKLNQLYTRAVSTGTSDGTGLGQLSTDELFQALREGRDLFASGAPLGNAQTAVDGSGCPDSVPAGTLREGSEVIGAKELCEKSVAQAATPEAARAIEWSFRQLGAPYACDGVGRLNPYRFDCSSLVSRAYFEGAGLNTAGKTWAPSTRDLMPWDGVELADWAAYVTPENARPGDLALYRSCTTPPCSYQHVVMMLADGYMLHTNRCGDVAHVKKFTGFSKDNGFAVARRVDPEKARA